MTSRSDNAASIRTSTGTADTSVGPAGHGEERRPIRAGALRRRNMAMKRFALNHFILAMSLGTCLTISISNGVEAGQHLVTLPVPRVTLEAGDIINLSALEERRFLTYKINRFSVVPRINDLIGQKAVARLPAGQPIPYSAISSEKIVKRGEAAQLIFSQEGLNIIAYVEPLEDGMVGETIRVRNVDSGLVVRGRVQQDGTISIGP